jgi:hypothetical protein
MECAICFEEIKNNELFKAGCCSVNLCIDCFREGHFTKCPQCKKPFDWILNNPLCDELEESIRHYKDEIRTLRSIELTQRNQIDFLQGVSDDLNKKMEVASKQLIEKDKIINSMKDAITNLKNKRWFQVLK